MSVGVILPPVVTLEPIVVTAKTITGKSMADNTPMPLFFNKLKNDCLKLRILYFLHSSPPRLKTGVQRNASLKKLFKIMYLYYHKKTQVNRKNVDNFFIKTHMNPVRSSVINGFLLINKPPGPTSHDIVDEVRRIFGIRKVGHAGTLDPFASGLLIIGIGKATKELSKIQGLPKTYKGTIVLGNRSTTDDPEGIITASGLPLPQKDEIESVFKKFTGVIMQVPPIYSAKKIGGRKLYEIARAGGQIKIPAIKVIVHSLHLLEYDRGLARFETTVSSGTYIRALARDMGEELGTGGYLKELKRTAIGSCVLEDSVIVEELKRTTPENLLKELGCATL